jgi:hypothetical protein
MNAKDQNTTQIEKRRRKSIAGWMAKQRWGFIFLASRHCAQKMCPSVFLQHLCSWLMEEDAASFGTLLAVRTPLLPETLNTSTQSETRPG